MWVETRVTADALFLARRNVTLYASFAEHDGMARQARMSWQTGVHVQ